MTTALVAVSPEVRDDLVALGVAPREKFTVIRLGVELEERVSASPETRARARRMMGIPEERFTVGWVGRRDATVRIFLEQRVQDGVADLVGDLVGVALSD